MTRSILEVLARFNQPVSVISKSNLITLDLDILGPMARDKLATAFISITTLDRGLARAMEPRLDACETPGSDLPTGRSRHARRRRVRPSHPRSEQPRTGSILEAAAQAGAISAMYVTLRPPLEIKDLFKEWLADVPPDRASRVMSLVRQTRGGKEYDGDWAQRMKGTGPVAELVGPRFKVAVKRYGLDGPRHELDVTKFQCPRQLAASWTYSRRRRLAGNSGHHFGTLSAGS